MLVQIVPGFWCDPELVAVVKETDEDACALFTAGQSAVDGGFTLEYPADKVSNEINEALEEMYASEEGNGDEDES